MGRCAEAGWYFTCRFVIGGCLISAPSAPEGAWAPRGAAWGRSVVRAPPDSEVAAWLSRGLSTGWARSARSRLFSSLVARGRAHSVAGVLFLGGKATGTGSRALWSLTRWVEPAAAFKGSRGRAFRPVVGMREGRPGPQAVRGGRARARECGRFEDVSLSFTPGSRRRVRHGPWGGDAKLRVTCPGRTASRGPHRPTLGGPTPTCCSTSCATPDECAGSTYE